MNIRLFPHKLKYTGWTLLLFGLIMGYFVLFRHFMPEYLNVPVFAIYSAYIEKTVMGMTQTNIADEITILLIISGLAFLTFSKQKEEKDIYMIIRAEAMFLSVALNTILVIIITLFFFGLGFVKLIFFNIFSLFIIYLVVFRIKLIRLKRKEISQAPTKS